MGTKTIIGNLNIDGEVLAKNLTFNPTILTVNFEEETTRTLPSKCAFLGLLKDYGDGVITTSDTHTFSAGLHTIKVYNALSLDNVFYYTADSWNILTPYGDSLVQLKIGNNITSINASTFKGCSNLISITIPDSVTMIDAYAFMECTGLTEIIIPNSVETMEGAVFNGCTGLKNVVFGDGLKTINGSNTFFHCNSLESVVFGKNMVGNERLQKIFMAASTVFENLTHITLKNKEPLVFLHDIATKTPNLTKVIVPRESFEAYKTAWLENDSTKDYVGLLDCYAYQSDVETAKEEAIDSAKVIIERWF